MDLFEIGCDITHFAKILNLFTNYIPLLKNDKQKFARIFTCLRDKGSR